MNLVKLKTHEGTSLFINPDHIVSVSGLTKDKMTVDGKECWYVTSEVSLATGPKIRVVGQAADVVDAIFGRLAFKLTGWYNPPKEKREDGLAAP